ncbi:MAG: hypothetical protein SO147_09615 [Clostridia bacterium]|nr:hypothetical protein [Clostridia bacterium]
MRKTKSTVLEPEELAGVKKQSFALPFRGGEIWFEHLDGMYQYTKLVLEKLKKDSQTFLLPSKPAHIAFVLDETLIAAELIDEIVRLLYSEKKQFLRVCLIGTDRKSQRLLRHALSDTAVFSVAFINDMEKAKEWLIPASK